MTGKQPREVEFLAGTNISYIQEFPDGENIKHRTSVAVAAVSRLNSGQDTRNVAQRLRAYRQHSETLIEMVSAQQDVINGLLRENRALKGGGPEQRNRRWTEEQDNALVELTCRDDSTMVTLALSFNRSPAAIASRLTYLVGRSRLSRHVVGRITGFLDGEPVSGVFDGELRSS